MADPRYVWPAAIAVASSPASGRNEGVRSRIPVSMAFGLGLLAASGPAHADDVLSTSAPESVPLHLDVEGRVQVQQGKEVTLGCNGPCTLNVPTGNLQITTTNGSTDVFVSRESRVTQTPPAPAGRLGGGVAFFGGVGILVLAVGLPLIFCVRSEASRRPDGTVVNDNPCKDASDAAKVAWISVAGVGLTSAIVGGIIYVLSGERLVLTEVKHRGPKPLAGLLPTIGWGTREGVVPGLSWTLRF